MIKSGQELHVKKLLSFRKEITENEMEVENAKLYNFIKTEGLEVVGPKISTTHRVSEGPEKVIDFEILIPVDRAFESTADYKFKKELKLVNCLQVTHIGNPIDFQSKILALQTYIRENRLMPLSNLYTVSIKEARKPEEMEKFQTKSYIAINPNIV